MNGPSTRAISTALPPRLCNDDLAAGFDVILEIELKGAEKVLAQRSDALMIYIMPPSLEELERRLRGRKHRV